MDGTATEGTPMEAPDDNLDHYALGYYATRKGLTREASPYAAGTDAHARWLAGYEAALAGAPEPAPRASGGAAADADI